MRSFSSLFCFIGPILLALLPAAVSGQPNYTYATPYAITTLAGTTSAGHEDGVNGRFFQLADVAVDAAGNLYIADTGNHIIRKRAPNGTVSTLAGVATVPGTADGTGTAAQFAAPSGIAIDGSGNLYVADRNTHIIRKISPAGSVTTLAGTGLSKGSTDGLGAAARFNTPVAVAVDAGGNVYVADLGNRTIRKITPAGNVTTLAGSPGQSGSTDGTGASARFYGPEGIAVDAAGYLFVADGGTIRKISPSGETITFAGSADNWATVDGTGTAARFAYADGSGRSRQSVRQLPQQHGAQGIVHRRGDHPGGHFRPAGQHGWRWIVRALHPPGRHRRGCGRQCLCARLGQQHDPEDRP